MSDSGQNEPNSNTSIPFFTNLIATGLFSGYIPFASGTFGTVVGILLYLLPGVANPIFLGTLIVIGFLAGVVTSATVARIVGNKLTRTAELAKATFQKSKHEEADPSIVVIDEIVGVWVTLLFVPQSIMAVALSFFFFRVFDIIKPPPAHHLERVPNGWGIMLDDVVAGIYANIAVHISLWIIRSYFPSLLTA